MLKPYVIDAMIRRQEQIRDRRPALHIRELESLPQRGQNHEHPERGVVVVDHTIA